MNYNSILRNKNIKCTKARIYILKLIVESKNSVNAYYIYDYLKNNKINLDLSTIYRTLDLFECKDIVEKFDIGNGKYNYIFKGNTHKHIIHCKLCNKAVEIDCPMPQFREIIRNKTGFTLVDEEVKFNGICSECIKKITNNK